jgi:predicted PurR-regulated permease PerM
VLYYWLTGSQARLPMLLLFFASLGGIAYFGFIGLFLGPLLLAVIVAMFRIYEEDYRQTKLITGNVSAKGPNHK